MKKLLPLFAVLAVTLTVPVHAALPSFVKRALNAQDVKSVSFRNGILRVIANRDIVNNDTYQSIAVIGVCWNAYQNAEQAAKIRRIEVLDNRRKDGLALVDGGKTCLAMNNMDADQTRRYIDEHTVVCINGKCATD